MHALQTFFAMGGYAAYVWPAYALFFVVLIADSVAPSLRRRRVLRELRSRLARQRARLNQSQSNLAQANQTLSDAARQNVGDHRSTTLPPSR